MFIYTQYIYIHTQLLIQDAIRGVTKSWQQRRTTATVMRSHGDLLYISVTAHLSLPPDLSNPYRSSAPEHTGNTLSLQRGSLLRANVGQRRLFLKFSKSQSNPWVGGVYVCNSS